ncbi:MAG: tetratricopeptide repeat protein [Planctomycetales bacterium]
MSGTSQSRWKKQLSASEGYLMLEMPQHALDALASVETNQDNLFSILLQRGLIHRHLHEFGRALEFLEQAEQIRPNSIPLQMALGWCYKRTDQLPRAIAAAEKAYKMAPQDPILLYNLACYWSLARDKTQMLSWLGRALRMNSGIKEMIPTESDFDPYRNDPDFVKMIADDNSP